MKLKCVSLFFALLMLSSCGKIPKQEEKEAVSKETTSSFSMKEVSKDTKMSEMEKTTKTTITEASVSAGKKQEIHRIQEQKLSRQETIDLLKCIGNGFANFSNISERNKNLRPFVTEECAKENGLDFESVCQLPSSGKIKEIYMPLEKENHYALVLECVQNGAPVKLLILVEITGDKVSHIDYNDVRESY